MGQGRVRDAAALFSAALNLDPGQADFHAGLAEAFFRGGALADAESAWRNAVALAPQRSELLYGLAEVLRHRGSHEQATKLYREVLSQSAGHQGARYHLAALGDREPPAAMPPELVSAFFDGYARSYDRLLCERLDYRAPALLRELLDSVCTTASRGWTVLDLGCGTGLSGLAFRDLAQSLVGVDLSVEMIERARARKLYDRLLVGDMVEVLSREGPELDLVVAVFVSDYMGDLRPLFEAVMANLRPGGRFALTVQPGDDAPDCETPDNETPDNEIPDYALRSNGRYVHSSGYVERIAAETDLRIEQSSRRVTREQDGRALESILLLLRRDAGE